MSLLISTELFVAFLNFLETCRHCSGMCYRYMPAVEAGIVDELWTTQDLLRVAERAI